MLKYAAGLALLLGLSGPSRGGELDNEQPAGATLAPAFRPAQGGDLSGADKSAPRRAGGSEMDEEAFQQDWGFRGWCGWGWRGCGWVGFYRPAFCGWGFYRPWGYCGWGCYPAFSYAWGCYPGFVWGYPYAYCW
jgi:hypothetical protein